MGVYTQEQAPSNGTPSPSFEDFLKQEQTRAAAERAMLDSPDSSPPPIAMATAGSQFIDNPRDMPPEVFKELVRRFGAEKRGSPGRNLGIETMEQGGKTYRYDAYAGQEAQGFKRDRTADSVGNFFQRLGQNFGPNPEQSRQFTVNANQAAAAARLREREMGADEVYRNAMLASQERTRTQAHSDASKRMNLEISGRAYDRAASRFAAAQPKPRDASQEGLSDAQAAAARALAGLYGEQANAVRGGRSKSGTPSKPDFTPDQAFTNMRQSEDEIRAIHSELEQVDQGMKHEGTWYLPQSMESYEPRDIQFKDAKGAVYNTIPAADVQTYRTKLVRDLDYYTKQAAKFREIVRNGNQVPDSEKGNDAFEDQFNDDDAPPSQDDEDTREEAEAGVSQVPAGSGGIDEDQAGKLAAAPPSQSGVPTAGKGRRPKPPPESLAKLPYRDQLYYQLSDEYPEASDRELKIMALKVIAMQATPRGGTPARPAPGHGR